MRRLAEVYSADDSRKVGLYDFGVVKKSTLYPRCERHIYTSYIP